MLDHNFCHGQSIPVRNKKDAGHTGALHWDCGTQQDAALAQILKDLRSTCEARKLPLYEAGGQAMAQSLPGHPTASDQVISRWATTGPQLGRFSPWIP